jgi:hypothetical protein
MARYRATATFNIDFEDGVDGIHSIEDARAEIEGILNDDPLESSEFIIVVTEVA